MKLLEEEKESRTAENRGGLWPSTKYQRRHPIPSLPPAKMHNLTDETQQAFPQSKMKKKYHSCYTVHAAECVHQTVVD